MKASELMTDVATVMADVLVHQRARWGALLAHQRQYEGWWKAEMALAIESWAWRADRQTWPVYARAEAKPRDFGLTSGPATADLVVAAVNKDQTDFDYAVKPRVWIELKERGTWWGKTAGSAAKAFGVANKGLWSDLEKWQDVKEKDEVVLVCQVTTHEGTYEERLAPSWAEQLGVVAAKYEHAIAPRCVGYELPGRTLEGKDRVRWTRFDCFVVNPG